MIDMKLLTFLFATSVLSGMSASAAGLTPLTLNVWDDDPPGFMKDAGPETVFPQWPGTVGNVSVPTLTIYLPPADQATGIALLYCSGGSYNKVSAVSDDVGNAAYFVPKGVAVVVLKYRTSPPSLDFSAALADAARAIRLVRHRSKEWNIDPKKIGMLGGSAGGHLILTMATHWDRGKKDAFDPIDRESCRPDFVALLCPWPAKQSIKDFPINKETPPALICSARDDTVAPVSFAQDIKHAYDQAGVPAQLWIIDSGGHTAFSNMKDAPGAGWVDQFWSFLKASGFMK